MIRLLNADSIRMIRGKWFWLCLGGMLLMAVGFITMQYTAMDYEVPLSRVIFLPMSFYGVMTAALVSMFIGTDYSEGGIRNKLIVGRKRGTVFLSGIIICGAACVVIYLITTIFTLGIGMCLFERDVTGIQFGQYLSMGILMCLAYSCIFAVMTMLCGSKSTSAVLCMMLAFLMLFFCLHTNQHLAQPEYKDGVLNPRFVDGSRRIIYGILHDLNPSGQAAQLSSMDIYEPVRWIVCDLLWVFFTVGIGVIAFKKRDIK